MSQRPNRNRQVLLKNRPAGIPDASHFEIVDAPLPQPQEGQVLVRNLYLSVEPAMRGWVNAAANYSEPVAIGAVMRSLAAGQVEASKHPDFRPGEFVTGWFGWQDYAVVDAKAVDRKVTETDLPLSASLGVLGLNGITAYFGLLEIGQPTAGETVVVSTAAGSVGSCVGQIAKLKGCRTVGIAGGAEKVRLCRDEFGFDDAIDYKSGGDYNSGGLEAALAAACPRGVDVYFDNTSGTISDAVYRNLSVGARVVVCGTASIAAWDPLPQGPRVERHLLVRRARMQGFVVLDFKTRYAQALAALSQWVRDGSIRYREDILDGIEQAPDSIAGLYRGENLGKRLIRLAPVEDSQPAAHHPTNASQQETLMGKMIELTAADGHKFLAYRAEPAGKPKGSLIVAMEIFGVNSHIRSVADGYAMDGYLAIAPALFDRAQRGYETGYSPEEIQRGREMIAKVSVDDALKDVAAALRNVDSAGKIGIVGYCWGGTVAFKAACNVAGLHAAISYYGGGVPGLIALKPQCPALFHWGETDQSIPMDKAKEFAAAHKDQTHFFYAAGHGFNCDQRGSYNAEAAKLARKRTLEFLAKYVG